MTLNRRAFTQQLIAALAGCISIACEAAPAPKATASPKAIAAQPAPGRVLILMHGRGAAADDLQPLADELAQAAPKVEFILQAAPLPFGQGLAWYPLASHSTPAAMDQARAQARGIVMKIVEELRTQGVSDGQIYVGGFSQGATVALDVVLSAEGAKLGGLVSLSGGVLDLDLAPLHNRSKLRAFVSHGALDQVLHIATSQRLAQALERAQHPIRYVEFQGGHSIPTRVRQELGVFLAAD